MEATEKERLVPARLALVGNLAHTPNLGELEVLLDHVVSLDSYGRISAMAEANSPLGRKLLASAQQVEHLSKSQFLLPGFVDTHYHAPQHVYTGTGTDLPLMSWLQRHAFPAERSLAGDTSLAGEVYSRVVDQCLSLGTTCAVYFASINVEPSLALAEIAIEKGQRAFIGKVSMDQGGQDGYCETTADALLHAEEFIHKVRSGSTCLLTSPIITPRFLPTCSVELLKGLGVLAAKYNLAIQSHISESADVVHLCRDMEAINGDCRDVQVFDTCNLLTPRTVLAHGVHLNDEEMQVLAQRGCTVSHCALSNAFFGNGVFRTREALNMGMNIALGTDVAGGYSPSMLGAMRTAVLASRILHDGADTYLHGGEVRPQAISPIRRDISYIDALWMATVGGARAVGLDDTIGSFAVGKDFDALLMDVSRGGSGAHIHVSDADDLSDVVQKAIHLADDRHIARVFVKGQVVRELPPEAVGESVPGPD
ncbi:unnamed protein product [Chrysoparadoxa australica]